MLSSIVIGQSVFAAGSGALLGPSWSSVSQAIGAGVYQWMVTPGNVVLAGIAVGIGGTVPVPVAGTLSLVPNAAAVRSGLLGASVIGPTSLPLAAAVASGVATAVSSAGQYAAISLIVASGTDTSTVTFLNSGSLQSSLLSALNAVYLGSAGPSAVALSAGLGSGLALMMAGMTGAGIVQGSPVGALVLTGVTVPPVSPTLNVF